MIEELKIIAAGLLNDYRELVNQDLHVLFESLKDAEISTDNFSFYTSIAAIASSRIEGEQMEIDSYLKHKMLNTEYQPNLVKKPDDLSRAYLFAQQNEISNHGLLQVHALVTAHLLPKDKQGGFRKGNMVVMEHQTGRIQFEAAPASQVNSLYNFLWDDIELLKQRKLTVIEVFYFASFIHLVFVNIHPFDDGNGRTARLLEKWFIASRLGEKAWYLQSELYYYQNANSYYKNLNRLGVFYDQLEYAKAMPFLLMLPNSFTIK